MHPNCQPEPGQIWKARARAWAFSDPPGMSLSISPQTRSPILILPETTVLVLRPIVKMMSSTGKEIDAVSFLVGGKQVLTSLAHFYEYFTLVELEK